MKQEQQNTEQLKKQIYSRQEYAKANFWDQRYSEKGGFFDWYAEYPQLKNAFAEYDIIKEDRILMVGCGNSKLSAQMYKAGYTNIVNIDISPSVIEQMKKEFPEMVWEVMDATNMSYKDGEFDVAIDKGTLDALISGKNYNICTAMLKECMRVLKESGQLIQITYGSPQGRKKIFESALPFQEYDYYHCRADLNDVSTLINLMRSNLGGKSLNSIVKDTETFAKCMKEFSIIKMLRKGRRNVKQFIVWSSMQKVKIEVNPNYLRDSEPAEKDTSKIEQKQQKIEQTKNLNSKVEQTNVSKEQNTKQKQQFNYQPRKQSFVYVYSIRPKFVNHLDQIVPKAILQELIAELKVPESQELQFTGTNQQNVPFNFVVPQQQLIQVLKAAKYLKTKDILYYKFRVNAKGEDAVKKYFNINLLPIEDKNQYLALRKTNIKLRMKLSPKYNIQRALQDLSKVSRHLINACDLHPCPKTYALFHVLKNRNYGPSVNLLLEKYWFPTYNIVQLNKEDIELNFSIPPLIKQKETKVIGQIVKYFKLSKVKVDEIREGYLSYINLQLLSIVGMASLSYSNQKVQLVLQEFWQNDSLNEQIKQKNSPNNLYNQVENTLALSKDIVSRVVAHILAFY